MVHVALTDVTGERYFASQRIGRDALGLAGAQSRPIRLWLGQWLLSGGEDNSLPWELRIDAEQFELVLNFSKASEPVLQGESGLSRKSAEPGNASYYYSIPRLATEGTVVVNGKSYPVRGLSWLDREWSTSALAENQIGWDWFALQLDDGTDLMYYRLRQTGGRTDPHSKGTLVRGGIRRELEPEEVRLEPLRQWESSRGGSYPVEWQLAIPDAELDLHIEPRLDNQEQHGIVRYWEGAVAVTGTHRGEEVKGVGYVELTGY
jgi:predicted secreted hydrolase